MSESIKKYVQIIAELRDANILTNKKDFTGQIGEWLVAQLYNGKRATSANQKGWDACPERSRRVRLTVSLFKLKHIQKLKAIQPGGLR